MKKDKNLSLFQQYIDWVQKGRKPIDPEKLKELEDGYNNYMRENGLERVVEKVVVKGGRPRTHKGEKMIRIGIPEGAKAMVEETVQNYLTSKK